MLFTIPEFLPWEKIILCIAAWIDIDRMDNYKSAYTVQT